MNNHKYFLGDKIKVANVKALEKLKDINPKYAEHMYYKNRIVEAFARSYFGGMDILEQPICNKCEKPGFWHGDKHISNACYCPACGTVTPNATEMRDYLIEQLKIPDEALAQLENILYSSEEEEEC